SRPPPKSTTRPTCGPSATRWATSSTTRGSTSTGKCCTERGNATRSAGRVPRWTGMAEADGAFLEAFLGEERAELQSLRFATVVGRFYEDLAERLAAGG